MDLLSLDDYSNGFLGGQQEGALELLKAMQAGQITGRDTADQSLTMEPLKAESLETTLKLLDFRMKDVVLYNKLPKLTAYNTVEEFLQLESYGSDRGGFYAEGELSDVEDSSYKRRANFVKYIQVTGEVTMQAQMVKSFVDAMRQEVDNKTMWIIRRASKALTKANSALVPQEWNSLFAQHASIGSGDAYLYSTLNAYYNDPVVVDLRGASLKQEDVEKAAVVIDGNFGNVSDLFAPTTVLSALSQDYYGDQRIMMNQGGYEGKIGTVAKIISTTIGDVALNADKFMKADGARTTASAATSLKAPNAPTSNDDVVVAADSSSKYITAEAGNVYYAVSSINRFGESALTLIDATAATLVAGSSVTFSFNDGGGAISATAYRIYRTKVTTAASASGLNFYPIFDISTAELAAGYDGASAGSVRDRGRILPDTESAFLTEMAEEILSYKQLAPVSKLDLAVISMSRKFIAFTFATPMLYQPKKMVKFVNCGKALTA